MEPHILTPQDIARFHETGYITIRGFANASELAAVGRVFEAFMSRELAVEGKDWGEHTPGLFNVTALSLYHKLDHLPTLSSPVAGTEDVLATLDRRALAVTRQLYGDADGSIFLRDYEQLLRKLPDRPHAVFAPHMDMQYWPKSKSSAFDTRTATFSLAVNAASEANGCLWALPGSHKLQGAYKGATRRLSSSRTDGGGMIELELLPGDRERRVFLPLAAGDATFHDEWLVHGSEGNASAATRDTLIYAYRASSMIAAERALGFRHSYNDGEAVLCHVREGVFP